MTKLLRFSFSLLLGAFAAIAFAENKPAVAPNAPAAAAEEAPPKTREEAYQRAGVKLTSGPATVPLGKVAELKLPEGYSFVGADSLDRFFELTQNSRSGNEVGVVLSPSGWTMYLDYDSIGYVKDDDKNQLDAPKLMASMTEGQDAANKARQEKGWDAMKVTGWATDPHYDPKTNHLKWAINLASSSDNFKKVWINESIRLLGRGGVVNVTLVSSTEAFVAAESEVDQLLAANFSYVAGEKYAEFKSGDKIAEYGLAALVLGGAGVVAAKTGLLAKFGVMLAKLGKGVILVVVGIGAGLVKLWNKIVGGKAPPERS